ncbi:phosphoribosyltransferase family protein [Neobacillus mesonae]|uniref:phosphoribosyltransferase family protein n=1 Tax=Neobacillus mesonae TaxID=1193713 RepID=UPI0025732ED0|nr:phosphoribosyltransferase family protein [Neobacillus mesonae]
MNNIQTSTLSNKKYTYHILDALDVEINVHDNPYDLRVEELFTMAARINKKRAFLFVSNVLGKHVPIHPKKGLLTGALLASRFMESVKGLRCSEKERLLSAFLNESDWESEVPNPFVPPDIHPVVIGFAETATALGHAFFSCLQKADYFHTTREELINVKPEVTFEEEHSHATSHRCYIPPEMIHNEREIILVDDEITTGKTALNIIKSIQSKFPRNEYTVVSILDWRSEAHRSQFAKVEQELGIKINTVSLLSGNVLVKQLREMEEQKPENRKTETAIKIEMTHLESFFTSSGFSSNTRPASYIQESGRFGLNSMQNQELEQKAFQAAAFLRQKRKGKRTLCLGTGEFMYLPMKIAAEMGMGVYYQSTTRSPIYIENREGYGARYGLSFPNPEEPEVRHFVYNIPPGFYDELFLFFEREVELKNLEPFFEDLKKTNINLVNLVFFSKSRGEQHADN